MSPDQARDELIEQFRTGSFEKIVAAIDALIEAKLPKREPSPIPKRCTCGETELLGNSSAPFMGQQHFVDRPCIQKERA